MSSNELIARDARHLWHPYTQHAVEDAPLPVSAASGATLSLSDGRQLIDGISSWWATLHGHGDPRLVDAVARQAALLDHVLFAGATHEPAVGLAEGLLAHTPPGLTRVFYSDDGSTAVEVALKIALQAWVHAGEPQRRVFVALEGGYHGDTFGAMSVGDPHPFFEPFAPLLFEARRVPANAGAVGQVLSELGDRAAGVLVEPLVQGAAGMHMYSADELAGMRAAADLAGVPLIADEVMTGFGRTGTLFACEQARMTPDIMCLGKGITGGMLPLAATLTTERLYESFLSDDRGKAFFHGHTFTANPIACALGLESLRLCMESDTPGKLDAIGAQIEGQLRELLEGRPNVSGLRRTGGIVALELDPLPGEETGYLASLGPKLRRGAIERGVLLRPLGNVLYALPPACTSPEECERISSVMAELCELAERATP